MMETYTDLPGIQLYTANFLNDPVPGKAVSAMRDTMHSVLKPSISRMPVINLSFRPRS